MSASESVIPEIYDKLLIKQRTCFARLSSNHSLLCYVPKSRATLTSELQSHDEEPVHLARLTRPFSLDLSHLGAQHTHWAPLKEQMPDSNQGNKKPAGNQLCYDF